MPLWHDPLDELIEELERDVPAGSETSGFEQMPPLWHLSEAVHALLYGSAADKKRVEPYIEEFAAYHERQRRRWEAEPRKR